MFRTEAVRRNVADNVRREHAIPAVIGDEDILDLVEELSFMDGDELAAYLKDELWRLNGDWPALIASNLSRNIH
ncbi:hypothetical protein I6F34_01225 [Bradyrhizobium sp. BRP05]|nr:hypothetical protein [Bradyrhizobium sp. BRP05]